MDEHAAKHLMKQALEPFALPDLDDLCDRLMLDWPAEGMHPGTILSAATDALCTPLGGEDSFGDLSWRVGPHHLGLPWLTVEMSYDNEQCEFTTKWPASPEQLERDFHSQDESNSSSDVVLDYVDEQLDDEDRSDVWRYVSEDATETVRCQEAALRIEQGANAQALLLDAIATNSEQGVASALDLGASASMPDHEGNTSLHHAARLGHHDLMVTLIHAGAGVNQPNALGQTPLHLSAAEHCAHGCLVLLALKADHTLMDNLGRTPMAGGRQRGLELGL